MERLRTFGRRLALPALVWAVCAAVYAGVAGPRTAGPTADNHFVHLADSFLHGQLGVLGNRPPGTNDWACYDTDTHDLCPPSAMSSPRPSQHWYVSFPPLPALLILPAVALFGPQLSDALFWALFAGLGPALLYALLRFLRESGRSLRTHREDLLLTGLFAFGTVLFFVAVQGAVWFAGHVVGTVMVLLYVWAAFDARAPFWAGLALGLAFLTRPTTAALVIFFAVEALRVAREGGLPAPDDAGPGLRVWRWLASVRWSQALRSMAIFALPLLELVALAMWMNAARWEDPFEFGHRYLMIRWRGRIETWGLFSYHYLSKNLAVFLASLPWFSAQAPHVMISRHGLALWVTTPPLLLTLWPKRRLDPTLFALYAAAGVVALWNLLYQNSGWVQFGYRFALDYLPVLFVLLALGGRRFRGGFVLAALFAVAVNTFGAITFDRAWQFYDDDGSQDRLFQPD